MALHHDCLNAALYVSRLSWQSISHPPLMIKSGLSKHRFPPKVNSLFHRVVHATGHLLPSLQGENRARDASPSSHGQACPSSLILEWDTSLCTLGPFTGHSQHLTDLKRFLPLPWSARGSWADNLTGRNLLLAGRSVYSCPSALRHAELRLTALSGPIHFTAAHASHLPAPLLNTARARQRSLCPHTGPRD